MLLPSRSKGLIEVVEIAIQGYNVHGRALEKDWFGNHRVDHFALSCKGPRLHRTDVMISIIRISSLASCRHTSPPMVTPTKHSVRSGTTIIAKAIRRKTSTR